MPPIEHLTDDGYDLTFGVNVIGISYILDYQIIYCNSMMCHRTLLLHTAASTSIDINCTRLTGETCPDNNSIIEFTHVLGSRDSL